MLANVIRIAVIDEGGLPRWLLNQEADENGDYDAYDSDRYESCVPRRVSPGKRDRDLSRDCLANVDANIKDTDLLLAVSFQAFISSICRERTHLSPKKTYRFPKRSLMRLTLRASTGAWPMPMPILASKICQKL